jgi:hypothetical protein
MLALTGVHHKAQLTVDQTSTSSVIINGCLVEFSVRLPHCDISNPKKLAAILTPTVRSPPLFSPTTSRSLCRPMFHLQGLSNKESIQMGLYRHFYVFHHRRFSLLGHYGG